MRKFLRGGKGAPGAGGGGIDIIGEVGGGVTKVAMDVYQGEVS